MRLAPSSTASQSDKNYFHLIGDILWFGIALAAITRFMSMYAIRLGATPLEQSLLVALPGLVIGLSTFIAGKWRNRFQSSDVALRLPGLLFRFVYLLPILAPLFPPGYQVIWLVLSVVLPAVPQGIAGVLFLTFMRESIGDSLWDTLNSRRFLALNIGLAGGALTFGALLTALPFPLNYQVMFGAAFGLSMISLWHILQTRSIYPTPAPALPADQLMPLNKLPGFKRVTVSIVVAFLSFLSVNAVIPLALVQRLGAEEGFIAVYGMVELMGGVVFGLIGDKLAKRLGSRRLTAVMLGLTALTPIAVAFAPTLGVTLIGAAATGFGWTGTMTGLLAQLLSVTPSYAMPRASARYSQLTAIGTFCGPLIGGVLANTGLDLIWVMLFGVTLRLAAAAVIGVSPMVLRPAWHRITHPRLAFASR